MTYKVVFSDASLFRDAVRAISELIAEGVFKLNQEGLKFVATDPTMVALVDFRMNKSAFEEVNVEGEVNIPVNLDNIIAVLKRTRASDKLIIEAGDEENKLVLRLEGTTKRKFVLPLLDIEEPKIPELKLDFLGTVEITKDVLIDGISDASIVADTVTFKLDKDKFSMVGEGDFSKAELVVEKGSQAMIGIDVKEPAKSKFSIDYLKKIISGTKLGDTIKLRLGNDFPLEATIKAGDLAELKYVLAPRVED
jgi:proliferating cell nuclear antigen